MRLSIKVLFISTVLFVASCTQESTLSKNEPTFKTTIIHINDHHSHIDADEMTLSIDGKEIKAKIGGFANVVSQIKSLQKQSINPITLHAGDALQGTMYYTLFKGKVDAKVMNQITWDAFTLGNHEFDDGDQELSNFLNALKAPVVSSNVIASPRSPLYRKWQPYRIIKREGERIAIIGLEVAYKTKHSSRPSQYIAFKSEVESITKYVQEIEAMGINKIILLSHFGFENDQALAKQISGVDVIIDGDSHTLLGDFNMIGLKSKGKYPTIVKSLHPPVCIAQAWQYSYVVGKLHVAFDKNGVISECQGTPILLLNQNENPQLKKIAKKYPQIAMVTPDSTTQTIINRYKKELESKKQQIIATSKAYIGHNRIPNDKYNGISTLALGSTIAPLIAKSYYLKSSQANCSIQNAGGVRTGLKKGQISIDDIYKLLPYSNTLIELTMSGKQIKAILEDALSAVFENKSTGAFPYGYAIRYDIDSTQPKGNRVSSIEILNKTTQKFMPLEMTKEYVVVANSYIAEGRDGYETFKSVSKRVDTYFDYAMSFSDMIKKDKFIEPVAKEYHPIKSYR